MEARSSHLCRFAPGKEPHYPPNTSLGMSMNRFRSFGEKKSNLPCRDSNLPARDLVSIQTRLSLLRWPRSLARLIQIVCNITFPYTKALTVLCMTHAFHITSSYHLNKTVQRTEVMQSLTVQRNINRTCASVTKIAHIAQKWFKCTNA